MGRKHCGKRRNCSLQAVSPFPTVFSKGLFPRASKGVIVWEWVKTKNYHYFVRKGIDRQTGRNSFAGVQQKSTHFP